MSLNKDVCVYSEKFLSYIMNVCDV